MGCLEKANGLESNDPRTSLSLTPPSHRLHGQFHDDDAYRRSNDREYSVQDSGAGRIGDERMVVVDESEAAANLPGIPLKSFSAYFRGDESFFVVNVNDVFNKHVQWTSCLPRVLPHYAVKCNSDINIIQFLASLGTNFDCASRREMQLVLDSGLVGPSRIIYANPCKQKSHLLFAREKSIDLTTFDSVNELRKIEQHYPQVRLLLRIAVDDRSASCQLNMKYGASSQIDILKLLVLAKHLNLNVVGLAFHVGSGQRDPGVYGQAIKQCRRIFDQAADLGLFEFSILDIGGGFPGGSNNALFREMADNLRCSLDQHFHEKQYPNLRIIAEPGRYYVESAFTMCTQIIGAKARQGVVEFGRGKDYYVNDSVYSSFGCIMFDHQTPEPIGAWVSSRSSDAGDYHALGDMGSCSKSIVWGSTCDGLDCLSPSGIDLPDRLAAGDWLIWPMMGAYTLVSASEFNGFSPAKPRYFCIHDLLSKLRLRGCGGCGWLLGVGRGGGGGGGGREAFIGQTTTARSRFHSCRCDLGTEEMGEIATDTCDGHA